MKKRWSIGLFCTIIALFWGTALSSNEIKLPGSLLEFVSYLKSYSATEENLVYYLNEILLFEQTPSFYEILNFLKRDLTKAKSKVLAYKHARMAFKSALHMTFNYRFKRIITAHRELKALLKQLNRDDSQTVSLELNSANELQLAKTVLDKLGLSLYRDATNKFRLMETYSVPKYDANHYYQLLGFNTWSLEKQLNRTGHFEINFKEFNVNIPWEFEFLQSVCGYEIDANSFAEILAKEKRFQMFIGLLFQLTDKEIEFLNRLEPNYGAWKRIYSNDQFLSGMFVLSHALRVKNNQFILPGGSGPDALDFWKKSVGIDPLQFPLQFLEQLACKDDGKLNYYYTFTFFLPEKSQKTFLFDFNHEKFRKIYYLIQLDKSEKINGFNLPSLKSFGFFSLMYTFGLNDGVIEFPGGVDNWAKALKIDETNNLQPPALMPSPNDMAYTIMEHLLSNQRKNHSLDRFIPIYCKFVNRPSILKPEVIRSFYESYRDYNVAIDFIERIPLKKPETVMNLLYWIRRLENLDMPQQKKEAIVAVMQCMLEILAQKATDPLAHLEYDRLVEELMAIQFSQNSFYDGIFSFLSQSLGIQLTSSDADDMLFNFLFPTSPTISILKQDYRLELGPVVKKNLTEIIKNQSCTRLAQLVSANKLLTELKASKSKDEHRRVGKQLFDLFLTLPLVNHIDYTLPLQLRNFLEYHSLNKLLDKLNRLMKKKMKKASPKTIDEVLAEIKDECLLHELKHYLVTCLYAVTLKDSKFQVFLNPNFTRYHDFTWSDRGTPWNNSKLSVELRQIAGYHLEGGLSRLNITLSYPFCDHVLGRETSYQFKQAIPIIYNNLDLFPYSNLQLAYQFNGLLIQFAEELIEKSRENLVIKDALLNELMTIVTGFRFRTLSSYIEQPNWAEKKKIAFPFYISELQQLGELFFNKKKFLDQFSHTNELVDFQESNTYGRTMEQMERLGNVYYNTFGTLNPQRKKLFPIALSRFFKSNWTGLEMVNELKVKAAYIAYLGKMPPQLLGSVIHRYLYMAADLFFRGTRANYNNTYYMYSVFNYLYFNQIYNDFRKQGVLRIK